MYGPAEVATLIGTALAASFPAPLARADTAILSVNPNVARPGQLVEVRAGSYRTSPPMPLYLVARARVPRHRPCGPKGKDGKPVGFCPPILRRPPRHRPFVRVGALDFRQHPRRVLLRFRVPRVSSGMYVFVIYCDPCHRGARGTLITDTSVPLRVR